MKTCCFTGPRPHKLGFAEESDSGILLKKRLKEEIEKLIQKGYRRFLTGMAEGTDIYAAEAVLEFKETYKDIMLIAALPYKHNGAGRSFEERNRFNKIINSVDLTVNLNETYHPSCFHERNRFMVDQSSAVIAVYSENGGTAYTIKYAQKTGKEVIMITDVNGG